MTERFDVDEGKVDWVLAEADGKSGKTTVSFIGRYDEGVDLLLINAIYGAKYSIRLKFDKHQVARFLRDGVREMRRVSRNRDSCEPPPSNVIPLRRP